MELNPSFWRGLWSTGANTKETVFAQVYMFLIEVTVEFFAELGAVGVDWG